MHGIYAEGSHKRTGKRDVCSAARGLKPIKILLCTIQSTSTFSDAGSIRHGVHENT